MDRIERFYKIDKLLKERGTVSFASSGEAEKLTRTYAIMGSNGIVVIVGYQTAAL